MREIFEWSNGNPGAMIFLVELGNFAQYNPAGTLAIYNKLLSCSTIRGTNLYVLYSDLCHKDMMVVLDVCRTCPDNVLEDACSRQDYSGRDVLVNFYNNQKTFNDA